MDDDELRSSLPLAFGGTSKEFDIAAQIERTRRGRVVPPNATKKAILESSESGSHGDSDSSKSDDDDEFPISHEIIFKTQERAVTTITIDPPGSRMVTGSTDCTIKFHDFASMTPNTLRAFKSVDPTATKTSANTEAHPVYVVKFNPNAPSQVLVISATPQAKILTRDGETSVETAKGDMYLRDMNMTKGHVSEITAGSWHPANSGLCVTAATDSTLRVWDFSTRMTQKDVIVHKSKLNGSAGRSRMTAVAWGSQVGGGNNLLVAGALDGSLLMWGGEGPYSRPSMEIKDAHSVNTWTSGIDMSTDGRLVVTRGGDDTIKLWDTRKFKQPINTATHASTSDQFPTSNIQFSPSSTSVITGSETGDLHILNAATLKPELVTPITSGSPLISVLWHERLNQIVTGSANSETHVLYDPKTSSKGAVMIISKAPKRRHVDDDPNYTTDLSQGISGDSIVNPGAGVTSVHSGTSYAARHPTIGLTASGRSRDPRRPFMPNTTPFAKSQPDERHVKERIPLSSMRDEDPREALMKYAEKAEREPMFTNAWKYTQPKTIYAQLSDEEDGGPERKRAKV